jgi:hypothetical protein
MTEQQALPPPQWPQLRLDFYKTAGLMSQWYEDGRQTTYPVSIHDVVSACIQIELSRGLLPPNKLFWRQRANQSMLGIYVPARRWRVQTADSTYHLPMPPFIFVGNGSSYAVFAVKKRPALSLPKGPSSQHDLLFLAPCPNVYTHGGICQGNTPFPTCSPQAMSPAWHLFMEGSLFNADLIQGKCQSHPQDVRQLWAELDGRKRFPLSELVPANMTLGNLLR